MLCEFQQFFREKLAFYLTNDMLGGVGLLLCDFQKYFAKILAGNIGNAQFLDAFSSRSRLFFSPNFSAKILFKNHTGLLCSIEMFFVDDRSEQFVQTVISARQKTALVPFGTIQ
jgi:hypothetical protein